MYINKRFNTLIYIFMIDMEERGEKDRQQIEDRQVQLTNG